MAVNVRKTKLGRLGTGLEDRTQNQDMFSPCLSFSSSTCKRYEPLEILVEKASIGRIKKSQAN